MKVIKKKTNVDVKKIDEFNTFACTHKFFSVSTGMVDQPYFLDIDWQVTINTKCEARYEDLVLAWRNHNK